jgi:hypothetical protein
MKDDVVALFARSLEARNAKQEEPGSNKEFAMKWSRRVSPARSKRTVRLTLEVLENRLVPSAATYLDIQGTSFALADNSGTLAGTVAVISEDTTTGAFAGTFTAANAAVTAQEPISGQLGAAAVNPLGVQAATVRFNSSPLPLGGAKGVPPVAATSSALPVFGPSVSLVGQLTAGNASFEMAGELTVATLPPVVGPTAPMTAIPVILASNEFVFGYSAAASASGAAAVPNLKGATLTLHDDAGNFSGTVSITSEAASGSFTGTYSPGPPGSLVPVEPIAGQVGAAAGNRLGLQAATIQFASPLAAPVQPGGKLQVASPVNFNSVSFTGQVSAAAAHLELAGDLSLTPPIVPARAGPAVVPIGVPATFVFGYTPSPHAHHPLELQGATFVLQDNAGDLTGTLVITAEQSDGSFTGTFMDNTNDPDHLSPITVSGHIGNMRKNPLGLEVSAIHFSGTSTATGGEELRVNFTGQASQAGNDFELAGLQDVVDSIPGQPARGKHEFVFGYFQQGS